MSIFKLLILIIISISTILLLYDLFFYFVLQEKNDYLLFTSFLKGVCIFWFLVLFLFSCASSKTVYKDKRLTIPPERYEIFEITNSQQALSEYGRAIFTIARWQNWYNINVGSNYYNYYNYSNELYKRKTNDNAEIKGLVENEQTND